MNTRVRGLSNDPRCVRCGDPLEVVLGEERIQRARQGNYLCESCKDDLATVRRRPKRKTEETQ